VIVCAIASVLFARSRLGVLHATDIPLNVL
jgi:hypothetical protein